VGRSSGTNSRLTTPDAIIRVSVPSQFLCADFASTFSLERATVTRSGSLPSPSTSVIREATHCPLLSDVFSEYRIIALTRTDELPRPTRGGCSLLDAESDLSAVDIGRSITDVRLLLNAENSIVTPLFTRFLIDHHSAGADSCPSFISLSRVLNPRRLTISDIVRFYRTKINTSPSGIVWQLFVSYSSVCKSSLTRSHAVVRSDEQSVANATILPTRLIY